MPPKKKPAKARGKKTRRAIGQSGDGVKDGAKKAFNFAKKHKLVSRGLAMIPHPVAQAASRGAAMVGLGKQGDAPVSGDGIFSDLGRGLGGLAHGIGSGLGGLAGGLFGGSAPRASQKYIQIPVLAL